MMEAIKGNVGFVMRRLDFPTAAQEVFLGALEKIETDKNSCQQLIDIVSEYNKSEHCDYMRLLADSKAIGDRLSIHEYTMAMLIFLCFAEKLRLRYLERGFDEVIYWNSMADLRYKLEECRLVHGIVGSFVAPWFIGFFNLTRFALGRLQFEIYVLENEYSVGDRIAQKGEKVINIHIPRTGTRLLHEQVLEAYCLAEKWFANEFVGRDTLFACHSWLLYPWHTTVFAPESNLAAFMGDFEIAESGQYDDYQEVWRLFDCAYSGDVDNLPQDSSLRRKYVERIKRGEPIGWGFGFFYFRNGEVLNEG